MIESQLSPQLVQRARAGGHRHNKTLLDYLDEVAPGRLDKVAVTDLNSMTGQASTLSCRQLLGLSKRIALGLVALGVERGDVVSCQLPNWWQFVALRLACLRIGAVNIVEWVKRCGLNSEHVIFMPSPMAHRPASWWAWSCP